ncbi:MAG: dihydrodipicolinate reductase [Lachnospiraceae bacterium]|nr:dihydrodipicolinate reductase [Lachnospiraceae bacterium]
MEAIKAVAYGCGRMGRLGIQFMYKKGVNIVGAIDSNPALAGMDVGEYADLGVKLGVKIRDDADAVLDECKPDIVIAALFSYVYLCEPMFEKVLSRGINLLTTCDESHHAWHTSPEVVNRLDRLAKNHHCTITGSGLQDVFWMNLPLVCAGGMHEIKRIEGVTTFNTDEYGPALADAYNIGRTLEEFEKKMKGAQPDGFLMRATNAAIIATRGLSPNGLTQQPEPGVSEADMYSEALGKVVPAGCVIGTKEIVKSYTQQGIVVESSDIGKLYREGEGDICRWKLYGEPDVEVQVPNVNSYKFTMSDLVNRIPDVINAAPGYQTNDRFGMTRYLTYPMECYVDRK